VGDKRRTASARATAAIGRADEEELSLAALAVEALREYLSR
jgi:hypothetical protein